MTIKPFDLEKALAGEPVVLRNGCKAFIKYEIPNELLEKDERQQPIKAPLRGYAVFNGDVSIQHWRKNGMVNTHKSSDNDILGMWQSPREQVTISFPKPLQMPTDRELDDVIIYHVKNHWTGWAIERLDADEHIDNKMRAIRCGCAFAKEEDAQAFVDAMEALVAE